MQLPSTPAIDFESDRSQKWLLLCGNDEGLEYLRVFLALAAEKQMTGNGVFNTFVRKNKACRVLFLHFAYSTVVLS